MDTFLALATIDAGLLVLIVGALVARAVLGRDPDLGRVRDPREPLRLRAACGEQGCTNPHPAAPWTEDRVR